MKYNFLFVIVIVFFTINFAYSQYLPLDITEMNIRTKFTDADPLTRYLEQRERTKTGLNINFTSATKDKPSIFLLPRFSLKISDKISFRYKVLITNSDKYGQRIGSTFERSGKYIGPRKPGDFKVMESYLFYRNSYFLILAGRFSPGITASYPSDISNNLLLPPVDGFYYRVSYKPFYLDYGHFWLGFSSPGDKVSGYSRFYAIQKIRYSGKYFNAFLGGKIIYANQNQSVIWRYLNPLDPFIVSTFNIGQHGSDVSSNEDNNVLLGGIKIKNIGKYEFLIESVVDEFILDPEDRKTDDDDFEFKICLQRRNDIRFFPIIQIAYTYSSDYVGIHYRNSVNYEIYGMSILSRFGPQYKRSELITYCDFNKINLKGWISLYNYVKGKNKILGTPYKKMADLDDELSKQKSWGIEFEFMFRLKDSIAFYILSDLNSISQNYFGLSCSYDVNFNK